MSVSERKTRRSRAGLSGAKIGVSVLRLEDRTTAIRHVVSPQDHDIAACCR